MMSRSPREETVVGIQIDEPHLSGACIRSLVKQPTTSSRTTRETAMDSRNHPQFSVAKSGEGLAENPPQQKKQVRRRLHTTRPYQERLMNMAEARREIVTALKFHRASMKQAEEQQKQQQQSSPPLDRIQPSRSNFWNDMGPIMPYSSSSFPYPPNHFPLPLSPVSPLLFPAETLSFTLPSQPPLGLNLNFSDFDNLAVNLYHSYNGNNTPSSIYSSSSPSSSSSPAEEVPSSSSSAAIPLHQVIDDEEMRSAGEQHQMEQIDEVKAEDDGHQPFDEVMEFPAWCDSMVQQHLDDCFSKDYSHDLALPCMDIGEIEGIDGEWLS